MKTAEEPKSVRLADLAPKVFGEIVELAVLSRIALIRERWTREAEWIGRTAFKLSPGYEIILREARLDVSESRGDTDIGLTAQSLCAYAQTGQGWPDVPSSDAGQAEAAADALGGLLGCLDSLDADKSTFPEEWEREQEDGAPVAVVARAALARINLARGEDVRRAWLCALTGVSPSRIRTLIAEGVLEAHEVPRGGGGDRALSPIKHRSASQWLRARNPSRT